MMPDFSKATMVLFMNDDRLGIGSHKLFIAPTDGYIRVLDCGTKIGYFLSLNIKINQNNSDARIKSIYHKCATTAGQSGMFPINKSDVLYMFKATLFEGQYDDASTTIIFYPGIFRYNF